MRLVASGRIQFVIRGAARTLVVLALLMGQLAHAEPDAQASEFFRAGEAAYARGDFPAAARAFEEAHRRAPHAATLYNAGLAWQWADQVARAADGYEAALRLEGLSPQQRRDATERLAVLETRLGHIRVLAPSDAGLVSVAHVERAPAPLTVHASPGQHEVRFFRPHGVVESTAVTIAAGATGEVVFARAVEPAAAPPAEAMASGPGRRWAWVALGTSVVGMGGAAVYTGLKALDARDEYNASARTDVAAYDRATTMRSLTNILWAGTALVAATGAFFLLSSPGAPASASLTPSSADGTSRTIAIVLGPGGASITASF
jgi:tetratricopeptide (TPR) repeat protein